MHFVFCAIGVVGDGGDSWWNWSFSISIYSRDDFKQFSLYSNFYLKKNNSKTNRRQYEINLNSIQNIGEKKWESVGACVCV